MMQKKRCLRGHDILLVGRNKSGNCRQCMSERSHEQLKPVEELLRSSPTISDPARYSESVVYQVERREQRHAEREEEWATIRPDAFRLTGSALGTSRDWQVLDMLSPEPDLLAPLEALAGIFPEGADTPYFASADDEWRYEQEQRRKTKLLHIRRARARLAAWRKSPEQAYLRRLAGWGA
jgi:hypothetical protein